MTGLHLSLLFPGRTYLCRLSRHPVLVLEQRHTGPDPSDPRSTVVTSTLYGWHYNPVYGVYQRVALHHYQLATMPGEVYPVRPAGIPA